MLKYFLTFLLLIAASAVSGGEQPKFAVNVCGDELWVAYKDEKCFKFIDQLVTHEDAWSVCADTPKLPDNFVPLLTINSVEEQEFINKYIFQDSLVVDNVWLGARRRVDNGQFEWSDGSPLDFTNWHEGSPSDIMTNNCTDMVPKGSHKANSGPEGTVDGLWMDTACSRRNLIVCQKLQTWPLSLVQKTFMDFRKQVLDNPVPLGFVYVQLPSQPEASSVWPTVEWKDVTSLYAGLFFRAEGGQSAQFGETQNEAVSRISQVQHGSCSSPCSFPGIIDLPDSGWSDQVHLTGYDGSGIGMESLRFNVEANEVRPKNTAIRIWKRIG